MKRVATVLLLAGCGGAGEAGEWRGQIEVLSSGARRITNPASGIWENGEAWRRVPELTLGSVDGSARMIMRWRGGGYVVQSAAVSTRAHARALLLRVTGSRRALR
jgi:hypothetical protein